MTAEKPTTSSPSASSTDSLHLLPLGGIIQQLPILTSSSPPTYHNIVQSFPREYLYKKYNEPYFGETIGRVANRIAKGHFTLNNGNAEDGEDGTTEYQLAINNGPNSLHGGLVGWGKKIWEGPKPVGVKSAFVKELDKDVENTVITRPKEGEQKYGLAATTAWEGGESVEFTHRDPHGNEGYPGTVDAKVTYTAGKQKIRLADGRDVVATVLAFEYEVRFPEADEVGEEEKYVKETIVNVTNHSYFHLSETPTIAGTDVTLFTNLHLPLDDTGIPNAGPTPHPNPVFQPDNKSTYTFRLGATEPDFDDCFVMPHASRAGAAQPLELDTRKRSLRLHVHAFHPQDRVHLEVMSTEPAFQFYTGKYIDVPEIGGGGDKSEKAGQEDGDGDGDVHVPKRVKRSAFCVEPCRFVDAVNNDEWRHMVMVKRGQTWGSRVVYRWWSEVEV